MSEFKTKFSLNNSLDFNLLKSLLNFQNSIPQVNYSVLIPMKKERYVIPKIANIRNMFLFFWEYVSSSEKYRKNQKRIEIVLYIKKLPRKLFAVENINSPIIDAKRINLMMKFLNFNLIVRIFYSQK